MIFLTSKIGIAFKLYINNLQNKESYSSYPGNAVL